jgi:hypothetical protein
MHNARTPAMRGLRTVIQLVLGQLLVALPLWLADWDVDPTTRSFVGAVAAGLIAWAQNELDDLRTEIQAAPLTNP